MRTTVTLDPDLAPAELEATLRTTPALIAERFSPPLPRVLRPKARWSGEFSGQGRIPAGSYVTFAFGRFTTYEPQAGFPSGVLAATTRPIRVQ